MNYLFTNAPFFVPGMKIKDFETHDLERRVEEAERKQSVVAETEEHRKKPMVAKTVEHKKEYV
jgi:hypothetical protein